MALNLGLGLGITAGLSGGGPSSQAILFAPSAARILNRNSPGSRASVVDGSGDITLTVYDGNSTINGKSISGGGEIDELDMPYGYSCPIRGKWILSSPQDPLDPTPTLTFANGMSTLFLFTGQRFEFKGGVLGEGSFAVRWSEDGGTAWKQAYYARSADPYWHQLDFGSAASRIVEVLGCDQSLGINGFNFDTGSSIPAAYTDADMPLGTMFGDSYVFGQNADDEGAGPTNNNNQKSINGQTRKLAEKLGCLQIRNHGLRGNRFGDLQASRSNYADRIDGGIYPDVGEAFFDGDAGPALRDFWVIPSTINDDGPAYDGVRKVGAIDAFRNLRRNQPNCLIMFPIGARAPQFTESPVWTSDYKEAFVEVFGATKADWIENGAYLHDGSRTEGANWTPAGAEGSSPYFGDGVVNPDSGHPTAAGHDYLAEKYYEGLIHMSQEIVKSAVEQGYGTEIWDDASANTGANWTYNGDGSFTADGSANGDVSLLDPAITSGKAYVVRLTVDAGMVGELRVRLGGGGYEPVTAPGDYSFVLDDRSSGGMIFQGLLSFVGTIRNLSLRSLD